VRLEDDDLKGLEDDDLKRLENRFLFRVLVMD